MKRDRRMKQWYGILSEEVRKAYHAAGFVRPSGVVKRAAIRPLEFSP
jgi:hypothetical protein